MKQAALFILIVLCAGCSVKTETVTTQRSSGDTTGAFKDGLIAAAIKTKLAADDIDSATRIHVGVSAGHVLITGVTRSQAQKDIASRDASTVTGVTSVDNQLAVNRKLPRTTDQAADFGLEAKLAAELAGQTGINAAGVKLSARNGVVTISGRARTSAIKATMLETIKKDSGVRSLVDKIAVVGSS